MFKALYGNVERIDRVDTSIADLNYNNMRNVQFEGNTFNGIENYVSNPLMIQYQQNSNSRTWTLPVLDGLPFQGWAKSVQSIVAEGPITDGSGNRVDGLPWTETEVGSSKRQIRLNWSSPVKGKICVYARMDRPQ